MATTATTNIRTGDCYRRAYLFFEKVHIGTLWRLCHGICIGTGPYNKGKPFGHAWIESPDIVIDSSGRLVPKEQFYKFGKVRDVRRFTYQQANRSALKHNHYGPWNPKIVRAERWIKS